MAGIWLLASASAGAASREENMWNTVLHSYNEKDWGLVLTNFNSLTNDFPASDHFSQGVLYLAQAEYHLAKAGELNSATKSPWTFREAADLLRNQAYRAGPLAADYLSWTAEAEYAGGHYQDAADLYARLAQDYETQKAEALYREAECYYQAKDLPRVVQKLGAPDGAFQQMVKTNATGESAAKAFCLLVEADLAIKDYAAAAAALQQMPSQTDPDLEWKRQYLVVRTALEAGRPQEAWQNSTNLLAAARSNGAEVTQSRMIMANVNLQLDQVPEAISNYEAVVSLDTNADNLRDALLNIVEIDLQSGRLEDATNRLDQFIKKYPDEQGSAYYSLLLGELRLRQHFKGAALAYGAGTNLLMAEASFQTVLQNTNSDLQGKAWLYLGWCWWAEGKTAESGGAFSNAVQLLPNGEDREEAWFKLGDVQYAQKDYPDAISDYDHVIEQGSEFAAVTNNLFEPALYQILQANIRKAGPDFATASNAVTRILAWFPNSRLGEPSELLLGQAEDRAGSAGEARATFADFITRWPQSSLRPEVELAIARTYERQLDWTNAIAQYTNWISSWSNNPALPVAEFSLATAQFQAGDESNAFTGFTNFVEQYPTNELTAQAQYWIGTVLFNQKDWGQAEIRFQNAGAATSGATPELRFEAKMMAGKVALARQSYTDAEPYFTELGADTNFPVARRWEARFALADVLTLSGAANNLAPVKEAVEIFGSIANQATNELAVAARGRMAGCYLLLAAQNPTNYLAASNCYEMVINATNADLAFRSQAEFGMAQTLKRLARMSTNGSAEWQACLASAIMHCLNVVNGNNLRDGESRDLREVQRCGNEAGSLMEELAPWDASQWTRAFNLYESMSGDLDLPAERSALKARMLAVQQHLPAKEN